MVQQAKIALRLLTDQVNLLAKDNRRYVRINSTINRDIRENTRSRGL